MSTKDLHTPAALRIYSHGLDRLLDSDWTDSNLFHLLEDPLQKGLADKTEKPGILHYLGEYFYEEYILENIRYGNSYSVTPLLFPSRLFYLNLLVELLVHHGVEENGLLLRNYERRTEELIDLYESGDIYDNSGNTSIDDNEFISEERMVVLKMTDSLRGTFEDLLRELGPNYAKDYAERAFHDRELCAHIGRLLISTGCTPTNTETGEPKQWVEREYIPEWAKRSVKHRERGKCAECGKDIENTLGVTPHIDHIIPLSKGGTNDSVNLQLLCDKCNLSKGTKEEGVNRSMPLYYGSKDESVNRSMTFHSG